LGNARTWERGNSDTDYDDDDDALRIVKAERDMDGRRDELSLICIDTYRFG